MITGILVMKIARFINPYEGRWVCIGVNRLIDISISGIPPWISSSNDLMTKYDLMKRLTPFGSSFHHPFNAIGNLEGTLLSMSVSKALLVVRAISSISQQSLPQLDLRSGLLLI